MPAPSSLRFVKLGLNTGAIAGGTLILASMTGAIAPMWAGPGAVGLFGGIIGRVALTLFLANSPQPVRERRNPYQGPQWLPTAVFLSGATITAMIMILLWVMDTNPQLLFPVAGFGGLALLCLAAAGTAGYRILRIRALPKIGLHEIPAHRGTRVVLSGIAVGPTVTSPWSGETVVFCEATRTTTRRTTRRDTRSASRSRATETRINHDYLGSEGTLNLSTDPASRPRLTLESGTFTLQHFPQRAVPTGPGTSPSPGASRGNVKETVILPGTPVWITGTLAAHADRFNTGTRIQVSGRNVRDQTRFLGVLLTIAAGLGTMFAALLLAALT